MATDSSHARIRELNHSAPGGLAISQGPGLSPSLAITSFSIAAMGIMSYYPCFWPVPTKLLSPSVAAAAFGFITMANLGGPVCMQSAF